MINSSQMLTKNFFSRYLYADINVKDKEINYNKTRTCYVHATIYVI
jgi:hypothetical protein